MIALFCAYILFSVGGLILFKVGMNYPALAWLESLLHLKFSLVSLGGCLCYVVSFLLYLLLVSRSELSLLYPLAAGISCVCVMVASALILRESISLLNWLGAALIAVGILLVNLNRA